MGYVLGQFVVIISKFGLYNLMPNSVFWPLLPRTSTWPNKIRIISVHHMKFWPDRTTGGRAIGHNASRPSLKTVKIVYDYKLTQNISHNIQSPMKPYQAVLYIKKKVRHRSITTSKYIKFRQPRPEIRGASKFALTVRHPVYCG